MATYYSSKERGKEEEHNGMILPSMDEASIFDFNLAVDGSRNLTSAVVPQDLCTYLQSERYVSSKTNLRN